MDKFKDYLTDVKLFLASHGTVRNLAIGFVVGFVVAKVL